MASSLEELPILEFETSELLRRWLEDHHANSKGVWLRIYKKHSGIRSVAFEQVLDEGLCFGWSESARRTYDHNSYLQKFTPRKTIGTQSDRNLNRVKVLITQGKMTFSGLAALGLDKEEKGKDKKLSTPRAADTLSCSVSRHFFARKHYPVSVADSRDDLSAKTLGR